MASLTSPASIPCLSWSRMDSCSDPNMKSLVTSVPICAAACAKYPGAPFASGPFKSSTTSAGHAFAGSSVSSSRGDQPAKE